MRFTRALARVPGRNFHMGITTSLLGSPCYDLALEQHGDYCEALEKCGLEVQRLRPDAAYPDSTFVEDTAVICEHGALLTRPGAPSRWGEVLGTKEALQRYLSTFWEIEPPGTLDGGDVCQADTHFFVGLSQRTNQEGVDQFAAWLHQFGCSYSSVDIRGIPSLLHLKSGMSYLGNGCMAVVEALTPQPAFSSYQLLVVPEGEEYAANSLRVNEHILTPSGFPIFEGRLREAGYSVLTLDMSEFQKMDGGLSCLSLRF